WVRSSRSNPDKAAKGRAHLAGASCSSVVDGRERSHAGPMMRVQSSLPARAGVGFKPGHFRDILASVQPIGFFEVHAENYMGAGGTPHAQLRFLREHYALSVHGVGLNLGSREPLDRAHLARLKQLCDRYQPECFSEHLAWSSHARIFFNDLLPLPYTKPNLR